MDSLQQVSSFYGVFIFLNSDVLKALGGNIMYYFPFEI